MRLPLLYCRHYSSVLYLCVYMVTLLESDLGFFGMKENQNLSFATISICLPLRVGRIATLWEVPHLTWGEPPEIPSSAHEMPIPRYSLPPRCHHICNVSGIPGDTTPISHYTPSSHRKAPFSPPWPGPASKEHFHFAVPPPPGSEQANPIIHRVNPAVSFELFHSVYFSF